jgi:hypothetical protein
MEKTGLLIIFIDPDKEPTKHVLKDLQNIKSNLEQWGGTLILVFKDGNLPENFDINSVKNISKNSILTFDSKDQLYNRLFQILGNEFIKDFPMLCLVKKDGTIIYNSKGYMIGIDDEIKKVISDLK